MERVTETSEQRRSVSWQERRVPPEQLRWVCDPAELPFETTAEIPPLDGRIGQERGESALAFGLEMAAPGYNIFVVGPPGTGRTTTVQSYVEQLAATRPTPGDWCYVYNFKDPACPRALALPAGWASQLAEDMTTLLTAVRRALRRAFESREYREQQEALHRPVEEQREQLLRAMVERAERQGFALSMTPVGPVVMPLLGGRPMRPEEFAHLPEAEQRRLREEGERLSEAVQDVLDQIRRLEREAHERMVEHDRQVARFAIGALIRDLQGKYREQPQVVEYLTEVQEDIVRHVHEFQQEAVTEGEPAEARPQFLAELAREERERAFERYTVNVLVDNRGRQGAPAVIEPNPTYYNLLGRIEYRAWLGAMVTDFRMIRPGALHRANGGYLVLNAADVLTSPFAWEALKRALRTGQIRIENLGEQLTAVPAATLRPEPIPLDVKVVLIGTPLLYYLLYFLDEDFAKLFRVRADFDVEMARTAEHVARYAAFVSRQVRDRRLRPFHRTAVAKIAEYGARLAEHQQKLSTRFNQIVDLVVEADYWAAKAQSPEVRAEHVARAIEQRVYRSNLIEAKVRELIAEGTLFIDTAGVREGQVNGLSVLDVGDYVFGRPVRITAQTALGAEGVVNIERETRLSGRIHNKGFLILTSFLLGRYAQDKPLALAARITFEQTYDEIEGDSAASSELYALLSSLSGLPLRQDIAVTGSVNQLGEIQPVGGVTQKIEGFFDVCRARGLTGQQGVIIPAANVKHLMLREDVVEAVRQGQFHVWAVRTIDEGIEILTGVPAGRRQADGRWEEGTVNARVDQRLREYAERLRSFGRPEEVGERRERPPAEVGPQAPRFPRPGAPEAC
ncbi:MAG TPA: ATP-binding protein [Chloroflexota bacterium]|nr:ATP-binding protein [Chloroflexota bacterium]